jgi:hypothetical protein
MEFHLDLLSTILQAHYILLFASITLKHKSLYIANINFLNLGRNNMKDIVKSKLHIRNNTHNPIQAHLKQLKKKHKHNHRQPQPVPEPELNMQPYEVEQEVKKATGKVFVSGTTVHGFGTKFNEELAQNDTLIIKHDAGEERRKVILVLSDKSACLNEAFSQEFNTEFYIQKPNLLVDPLKELEEEKLEKKQKRKEGGSNLLKCYDLRLKRGPWTYKSESILTDKELTREEMLNLRSQKVRDKFCWM